MKILLITLGLLVLIPYTATPSDDATRKKYDQWDDNYIEIYCRMSGGMKIVKYEKYILSCSETIDKNGSSIPVANMEHFVTLTRETKFHPKHTNPLRTWIENNEISTIKQISKPEDADHLLKASASRYPNSLTVYINSKEYHLDHYTIHGNPQLQKAFKELCEIANKLTETKNGK